MSSSKKFKFCRKPLFKNFFWINFLFSKKNGRGLDLKIFSDLILLLHDLTIYIPACCRSKVSLEVLEIVLEGPVSLILLVFLKSGVDQVDTLSHLLF